MKEYTTKSYEETRALAESFAKKAKKGCVIGFLGELGSGKTAFTNGFVKGLGIKAEVSSPTFAICNVYTGGENTVYHFDMYRIDGWDDLYTSGFFEALDTGAYILCEWSENIFSALPEDSVIIRIEKLGENERKFIFMSKEEVQNL